MGEFGLIQRHFAQLGPLASDIRLGVGDDCALLAPPPGCWQAVSVDTSIAGRHFLADADPWAIGWRALAVALSDLAAMNAKPSGFTLALTLPEVEDCWLADFSAGLRSLSEKAGCPLIGGDTTRGLLSATVQVMGWCQPEHVWRRGGAQAGDLLVVTGSLGSAFGGLQQMQAINAHQRGERWSWTPLMQAYMLPEPPYAVRDAWSSQPGVNAAIDVSDGLLADCRHLLEASGVGALIQDDSLPIDADLEILLGQQQAREAALSGGDDYVLLCAVASDQLETLTRLWPATVVIGECTESLGIKLASGRSWTQEGFNHFL